MPIIYPEYPGSADDSTISRPTKSSISRSSPSNNVLTSALNLPVPVAYGECYISPLIFIAKYILYNSGSPPLTENIALLGLLWAHGEIQGYGDMFVKRGTSTIYSRHNSGVLADYTGIASQPVDPDFIRFSQYITGDPLDVYDDNLVITFAGETVAFAYTSYQVRGGYPQVPASFGLPFPREIIRKIYGKKIYDPRTTTTAYSRSASI